MEQSMAMLNDSVESPQGNSPLVGKTENPTNPFDNLFQSSSKSSSVIPSKANVRIHPTEMQRYLRNLIRASGSNLTQQLHGENEQDSCDTLRQDPPTDDTIPKIHGVDVESNISKSSSGKEDLAQCSNTTYTETFPNSCMQNNDSIFNHAGAGSSMMNSNQDQGGFRDFDTNQRDESQQDNSFTNRIKEEPPQCQEAAPARQSALPHQPPQVKEKQKNDKAVEVLHQNEIIARFRTQTECAKYLRATPEAVSYHCSKGGGVCNGLVIRPAEKDIKNFGLFNGADECRPKVRPQLAPEAVAILKDWLLSPEHLDNPYPNQRESEMLLKKTGLDKTQLKHWFNNARKRILKPLLKNNAAKRRKLDPSSVDMGLNRGGTNDNTAGTLGRLSPIPPTSVDDQLLRCHANTLHNHNLGGFSRAMSPSPAVNTMPNFGKRSPSFFDQDAMSSHTQQTSNHQRHNSNNNFRSALDLSHRDPSHHSFLRSSPEPVPFRGRDSSIGAGIGGRNGDSDRTASLNDRLMGFNNRLIGFNERSVGFNERSMGFNDRSMGPSDRLLGLSDRMMAGMDRSTGFDDRPIGSMERGSVFEDRFVGSNDRAMGFNDRSLVSNERTAGFNERSLGFNDRPLEFNDRSLESSERPMGFNNRSICFNNRSMESGERAFAMNCGPPNERPMGSNQSSINCPTNGTNSLSNPLQDDQRGDSSFCANNMNPGAEFGKNQEGFFQSSFAYQLEGGDWPTVSECRYPPSQQQQSLSPYRAHSHQNAGSNQNRDELRCSAMSSLSQPLMPAGPDDGSASNTSNMLRSNAIFKQQVAAMAMNDATTAFKDMEDAYMRAKEVLDQSTSYTSPEDDPAVAEANAHAKKCHSVAMFKLKVSQRANEEAANAYKKYQRATGGAELSESSFL